MYLLTIYLYFPPDVCTLAPSLLALDVIKNISTAPVFHQERPYEATLAKVDAVVRPDRHNVHGNRISLHLLERPPNLWQNCNREDTRATVGREHRIAGERPAPRAILASQVLLVSVRRRFLCRRYIDVRGNRP